MSGARAHRSGSPRALGALVAVWVLALVVSGMVTRDGVTWLLEVAPVLIAAPLLLATRATFPFTTLAYWLIGVHGLILIVGGTYTYAQVPAGLWVQEWLALERNPYDRLGHLAQGFIPAIVAREILVRAFRLAPERFLFFITLCICLAISALYELVEWWTALALGEGAQEFLGTQGDEWDTQWDMFLALVGAAISQLLLSRVHDRQVTAMRG